MSEYSLDERRIFLQFLTGCPRLPYSGFKGLSPPLTVVRKSAEGNTKADEYLPSVMTCVNYLKLPEYTSLDIMKKQFHIAMIEGQGSFHLS
jgi:E3 ubiquitin-protein ligase TRIP12